MISQLCSTFCNRSDRIQWYNNVTSQQKYHYFDHAYTAAKLLLFVGEQMFFHIKLKYHIIVVYTDVQLYI
jgi:hypothetical protein